jgi:hypothetical protein
MNRMLLHLPTQIVVLLVLLACVAFAISAGAPSAVSAGPPGGWRAGEPAEQPVPLAATTRGAVERRAEALGRALGIPGRAGATNRVFNRIEARALDEVDLVAADGRATGHFKLDAVTGALRSAVHLDWRAGYEVQTVGLAAAPSHASRIAAAAGVPVPAGRPGTTWDDGMTAWHVHWGRSVSGVPASGGTSVWLFPGGQVKAIALSEPATEPAPASTVDETRASEVARDYVARNGIDRFEALSFDAPVLRWVAGNDFVATGKADAPEPTLRLAWVVRFRYEVPGWRLPHQVELYVDAGSGELIGGAETA